MGVTSPTLTDRQLVDYYLADQDVYKKAVKVYHVRSDLIQMAINYLSPNFTTMLLKVSIQVNWPIRMTKRKKFIFLVSSMQLEILRQGPSDGLL